MHIVSRRTMLALPVERLVGNSNHSHRRPPMSPDSSASDSSNSDSPSTTNAKVFSSYASQLILNSNNGNSNNINSTASISNGNNGRPSESPVMNNNSHFISSTSPEETEVKSFSPRRRSVSPPTYPNTICSSSNNNNSVAASHDCHHHMEEDEKPSKPLLTASQSMTLLSNKDRNKEDRVEIQFPGKVERERDNSAVEAEGNSGNGPCGNTRPSVVTSEAEAQKMTIRIIEDEVEASSLNSNNNSSSNISKMDNTLLDDSSDENNSICGRPPSRPPSSSSSIVTSATFPLSPHSVSESIIKGSNAMLTRPQHHHSHHHHHHHNTSLHGNSLKFSIEDILRPEFGKVALQRIRRTSSSTTTTNNNNSSRRHSVNSSNSFLEYPDSPFSSSSSISNAHHRTIDAHHHGRSLSHSPRCDSIDSSNNSRHVRTGPSSIKDHSEDSNSSCTSRKEEVVDETKVNPPVPQGPLLWPAWVYCTRYSDRPSSGPRSRRIRKKEDKPPTVREQPEEKRPRTAFTAEQLARLKQEFDENRYLTERRRQDLARDLKLHENQIKIWFQNKRAKLKKSTGTRGGLAIQLMAQGLYNHSTVPIDEDDEMYEAMMQQQ